MNRSGLLKPSLIAAAAMALLLGACGGDDGVFPEAPPASLDADEVDAPTLAEIKALVESSDQAALAQGPAGATLGNATDRQREGQGWQSRYPGLTQTNLVANKPEYGALLTEPLMTNAWGIAIRPAGAGGHFWVGAAGSGQSIQYVGDVGGTPLFQDDLTLVDARGAVTGVAFNPGPRFVVTQAHAAGPITAPTKFFFANASGTITAWTERPRAGGGADQPVDSVVVVDRAATHAAFLGVTVSPDGERLVAADFGADAKLRVYDGAFVEQAPVANPYRAAGVAAKPGDFEAFNVQSLGTQMFAMYGRHVAPDPTKPPPAEGRLAEFDAAGKLVARWRGRGYLNYPWGVQVAPEGFGAYGGCLIVGNFGDGTMVAFHPRLKVALDYVRNADGQRIVIDGLWGLQFGNGASLGEAKHMYFAAGPNREADGLFGKLQSNPATAPVAAAQSMCR